MQLADLHRHLKQMTADVNNLIPDKNFSGLAVIDMEHWSPIWAINKYGEQRRKYLSKSLERVQLKHTGWNKQQIEEESKIQFEHGAR